MKLRRPLTTPSTAASSYPTGVPGPLVSPTGRKVSTDGQTDEGAGERANRHGTDIRSVRERTECTSRCTAESATGGTDGARTDSRLSRVSERSRVIGVQVDASRTRVLDSIRSNRTTASLGVKLADILSLTEGETRLIVFLISEM